MIKTSLCILIFTLLIITGRKSLNANTFIDLQKINSEVFDAELYYTDFLIIDSAKIDNNIFFLPDGNYYYSLSQKYSEINDNFIKEIVGGNFFVIFNWVKSLFFTKNDNVLTLKFSNNELYNSQISQKLIKLQNKWIGYLCTFVDNNIEINYEQFVSIKFEILNNKTLMIKNVEGIEINQKNSIENKLITLLDISRYKLLYSDDCVFFGIVDESKEGYFEYYIYTSLEDIEERGLNEVFNKSNENIRTNLKPFVIKFFE